MVYSPECARYACSQEGIALAQGTSNALRSRQRGRSQRILAEYVGGTFPWAIHQLTREADRHGIQKLARRLAGLNNLSSYQADGLGWCILDACAIERWLTIGGHFAGPGRADHKRSIETDRAQCVLREARVDSFEVQGPGLLCILENGSGLTMRNEKSRIYMRLETPESLVWYRSQPTSEESDSCTIQRGPPLIGSN